MYLLEDLITQPTGFNDRALNFWWHLTQRSNYRRFIHKFFAHVITKCWIVEGVGKTPYFFIGLNLKIKIQYVKSHNLNLDYLGVSAFNLFMTKCFSDDIGLNQFQLYTRLRESHLFNPVHCRTISCLRLIVFQCLGIWKTKIAYNLSPQW